MSPPHPDVADTVCVRLPSVFLIVAAFPCGCGLCDESRRTLSFNVHYTFGRKFGDWTGRAERPRTLPTSGAPALDFDADGAAHRQGVRLLDPYPDAFDARIGKAVPGDALRQGLEQVDVLLLHQKGNTLEEGAVIEHVLQPVGDPVIIIAYSQIGRQQNALLVTLLEFEHAADEDDLAITYQTTQNRGLDRRESEHGCG